MTTNREKAADILAAAGAYCGQCCFGECGEPDCPRDADWRACPDCAAALTNYTRALADAGLLAPEDNDEVVRLRQALEERIRVWLIVADKLDNRGLAAEADVTRIHANELTRILEGGSDE